MVSAISHTRLTLGLDIIGKLSQGQYVGYHELGIVKQKISLGDTITIDDAQSMSVSCKYPGVPEDSSNICWQAVDLLKREYGVSKSVHIDIDKVIPVQGGLAGGSTNAATVIMLLDELWGLGMSLGDKIRLGRQLGMDVPFYFTSNCAFDSEATEQLRPIEHAIKMAFVLVVPPFGVSTAEAYEGIDYSAVGQRIDHTKALEKALHDKNYMDVVKNIHNDFELSVFKQKCELITICDELLELGADASFMSGSGSTVVGVFEDMSKIPEIAKKTSNMIIAEAI